MKIFYCILLLLLWIWFFGCIKTYRFKKHKLVDGMGIHSAEFIMLLLYSICCISFLFFEIVGKWILFLVLIFWITIQFFCHWFYTIFGAKASKIKGYNECFKNTIHLFKARDNRIIPDLYHILLHTQLLILLILLIIFFL